LVEMLQTYSLLTLTPLNSSKYHEINLNLSTIGRHSSNNIQILEESVSRLHAEIEYKENEQACPDSEESSALLKK